MYTKPGPWNLYLRGTPCAICGQPAERLTVFAGERVITHEEDSWPPCQLLNPRSAPPATTTEPVTVPEPRRRAA